MMFIPLILIITGNIAYDILEKTLPKKENTYLHLVCTYLIALFILIVSLFITKYDIRNILSDLNLESIMVGLMAFFIDYGFILSYKRGWKISSLSITYTIFVLLILTIIGVVIYKETISKTELIGVLLCICSTILMNYQSNRKARGR